MGVFDIYGSNPAIQIKAFEATMTHYEIGAQVPIIDGVYIARDGLVVVKDGRLLATFGEGHLFSKWGDKLVESVVIREYDHIQKAIWESRAEEAMSEDVSKPKKRKKPKK